MTTRSRREGEGVRATQRPPRFERPTRGDARFHVAAPTPPSGPEHVDRGLRRALACADATATAAAFAVAVGVLGTSTALRPGAVLVVPLAVLTSKLLGLYDRDELVLRKTTLDEGPRLFQLAALLTLVIGLLQSLFLADTLRSRQLLGLWIVLFGAILVARILARTWALRAKPPERCLVLGDHATAQLIRDRLRHQRGAAAVVVGTVPLGAGGSQARTLSAVADAIATRRVQRVIVALSGGETERTLELISLLKGLGVRVSVVPRLLQVIGSSVEFDDINGAPILGLRAFGLSRSSRAIKRTIDVVIAGVGILVTAPLATLVIVAVKLDGGGPVLVRDLRVGRDGRRFYLVRFRTVRGGATDRGGGAAGLTPLGRLLERTSLHRLPQLVNVLCGEMSLVGPRPLFVHEDERLVGGRGRRLRLTPGMTGQWQTLGTAPVPLDELVTIDYLYVANWSLWTDVKILLRTAWRVLRGVDR
jgi:lipopolysaccharide/colanic/teichoic acid biosynthesis glycosyltransferase/sulfur relay (sulfurtransferase) DsrF/TusC family protein